MGIYGIGCMILNSRQSLISDFIKDLLDFWLNHWYTKFCIRWGVAKLVRHGTLTPAFVGSSPAAPANKFNVNLRTHPSSFFSFHITCLDCGFILGI